MKMCERPINKMKMFYTPYNVLYINISLEIKGVPYTTGRQLFKISWTFWSYDVCMQISSISVIKTTERTAAMWLVNLKLWVCWLEFVKILIFIRVNIFKYTAKKIRKLNEQIKFGTTLKSIHPTHIYMTADFLGLLQTLVMGTNLVFIVQATSLPSMCLNHNYCNPYI